MYVPKHFREDDPAVLHALMSDYSFATLVSTGQDGLPLATQLPFVFEPEPAPYGTLTAHMALGNPQWRTLEPERRVLVIFQGPHGYITPSWYENDLSVPTWNYASVQAYGSPQLIQDHDALYAHLRKLVGKNEGRFAQQWQLDRLPGDYVEQMMKGVVGFEIEITSLTGKFKMSQNRSESERVRISAELQASSDPVLCEVGQLVTGARRRG
ncbi:MAG: FMN-binding negative transcriptional regulator [Ktedonobacterales bacterium]